MSYIKSYKDQNYLLGPNIKDMFSKNHVCHLIERICNDMDYSKFDQKYAGAGHPAYHPRINLKLLLISQADGITSSRKMAKNAQENVVYIYLTEKVKPNFRTINEFRRKNGKLIKNVFRELNMFALEEGLIDLSHISVDGTKIRANGSGEKVVDIEKLKKIDQYIDRWIEEGIRIDEEEDKLYGDRGIHELPEGILDPKRKRPTIKKIVDRINEAMKKTAEVQSYRYDLTLNGEMEVFAMMEDGKKPGVGKFNVSMKGLVDSKDTDDLKFAMDMSGSLSDGESSGSAVGEVKLNKDAVYFNVKSVDTGLPDPLPEEFTSMFGKWWKITLPEEAMEELSTSIPKGGDENLTPEEKELKKAFEDANFFLEPKYVGIEDVEEYID
ncbi:MAG: transposase, partial [Candidatus Dadabacteria bacterium]|nr:transposase [Candidatus Dadabacteria bacterium]